MKNLSFLGKFCVALILLTAFTTVLYGQYEVWVRRYNGPGNGNDSKNWSMAVDPSSGNVYVAGSSLGIGTGSDYATVAYDSSGNELWVSRYNGPENLDEGVYMMTVDQSSGNVYVTGSGGGYGYVTVAYDNTGNELWVNRYNGTINGNAHSIAVDSASGNIFVTGGRYTIAYDITGYLLWINTYNEGLFDGRSVAVDSSSGNVYVTGYYQTTPTGLDFCTMAFDNAGNRLWVNRYNGPENSNDYARIIAVDSQSGNVYISGPSPGIRTCWDYATVAYNSAGNELWVSRYSVPTGDDDSPEYMTVDPSSGNIYVTGHSWGSTGCDLTTVAYDNAGNELWVKRWDNGLGSNYGYGVAVDSRSGRIYVTGHSLGSGTSLDYATVAYDSAGNELWAKSYNGPANKDDVCFAIAVDPTSGSVYVSGYSWGGDSGYDFVTIKYFPYTPSEAIQNLITLVEILNLQQGIDNSLDVKLDAAYKALQDVNDNNIGAAVGALQAFINAVEAQRGIKISEPDANTLIAAAEEIIIMLNNM